MSGGMTNPHRCARRTHAFGGMDRDREAAGDPAVGAGPRHDPAHHAAAARSCWRRRSSWSARRTRRCSNSLRIKLTDDAAPGARCVVAAARRRRRLVDRVRGVVTMYQDNLRLERENERLLQWQQVALKLSGDNREPARPAEGRAGKRGVLCHRPGHRQFRRRLCAHRDGQCRQRAGAGARPGGDHRRRSCRAADRGRQPGGAGAAGDRPQFAHPGRSSSGIARQRHAGRRQFRAAAADLLSARPRR